MSDLAQHGRQRNPTTPETKSETPKSANKQAYRGDDHAIARIALCCNDGLSGMSQHGRGQHDDDRPREQTHRVRYAVYAAAWRGRRALSTPRSRSTILQLR